MRPAPVRAALLAPCLFAAAAAASAAAPAAGSAREDEIVMLGNLDGCPAFAIPYTGG
jgi:hypothetical protein